MQIWSWELVLIIDINWINMYIGLLFNHIWIWAQCVFWSESEVRLGLYRSNVMREPAGAVGEGTPRSLKPTQLLFINSCHRSVCSCVREHHSHMDTLPHSLCYTHIIHAFTNKQSCSETTPKPEACFLFSWKSVKLLKGCFVKREPPVI